VSSAVDLPRAGALGRASDAQLTSLVRQGNQEAFAALYARHKGIVDAVARASSRERAEDIAQEAWTSAYRALSGPGEPIEHVGPWLATIARNAGRDRHRRDTRQPVVTNDEIVAATPAAGGVESALEGKQNIGRLMGAIDELPDEQRVILHLREFGGLTYKQIAEQLGKPESTIEAALFRARRKMAKEYAELHSGRRCGVVQSQLLTRARLSHVERLRLTRHLGRCASCERVARLEGAEHLIPAPRLARIAGTIPMPAVVARLLASGADATRPLVGKAAVAAVAVVAGAGVVVVSQDDGGAPVTSPPAQAAATPSTPVLLSAAPHVVRSHRVKLVAERKTRSGSAPATTTAATPVATSAPSTTNADPPRFAPVTRKHRTTTPRASEPALAPAPAPAPQPAAAPAPTPVAAPAPQPTAPAGQPAQQPVAQAAQPAQPPATGRGPSVSQSVTCLVAACRVGP
jgi:RNA polymerase sigma-70 factor (ECF subfamily)